MTVLLDRPSTDVREPGSGLTVLLAGAALALTLLIASGMEPWPARGASAADSTVAAPANEPTLVERTRHEVVTGA